MSGFEKYAVRNGAPAPRFGALLVAYVTGAAPLEPSHLFSKVADFLAGSPLPADPEACARAGLDPLYLEEARREGLTPRALAKFIVAREGVLC